MMTSKVQTMQPLSESRDPESLNDSVQVALEEVMGEPAVPGQSPDCVWNVSRACFNFWQMACYRSLVTVCGIPLAATHGCLYANTAFCHAWCLTPRLRAWKEDMKKIGQFWGATLHCCCDPCVELTKDCSKAYKQQI